MSRSFSVGFLPAFCLRLYFTPLEKILQAIFIENKVARIIYAFAQAQL